MNKFWGCLLVAVGITFAFSSHAVASGQKVGYLDVAKVISQSQWGKQISTRLRGDQQQLASSLQVKKDAFTSAQNSYVKKRDIMDTKARGRKEQELGEMYSQLQKAVQDAQMRWTQQKKAAMEPLFRKLYEVAEKVARDKSYDLVVDRSALIVASPQNDLTSEVISKLDRSPR
ncbi:MAG: OmpH family outer membrane protein [Syntrophobacteraceae bacterium]|nr:OmpH family outer membrane protein [Syntrophobacteraceae bacterium]